MNGLLQGIEKGLSQGLTVDGGAGLHGGLFNNDYAIIKRPQTFPEYPIGNIYNASSWDNLNDFVINGITASVNGSKQIVLTNTPIFTKTLDYNRISRLENWTVTMRFIVQADQQGGFVGMRSTSTYLKYNVYGSWSNDFISIQSGLEGSMSTPAPTVVALAANIGDTIEIRLTKNQNVCTLIGLNLTLSTQATTSFIFNMSVVASPLTPNTGRFCFGSYSSNTIVLNMSISSNVVKNSRVCFIVDSIGEGYSPSSYNLGYVRLVNRLYKSTIISCAENDSLNEGLAILSELKELNSQTYVIAQGINDFGYGASQASIIANYSLLASQLIALNKRVVHIRYYSTAYDMSFLWDHIRATYPEQNCIDTTIGLVSGDLLADGIHLNTTGNAKFAANLIKSGKL